MACPLEIFQVSILFGWPTPTFDLGTFERRGSGLGVSLAGQESLRRLPHCQNGHWKMGVSPSTNGD